MLLTFSCHRVHAALFYYIKAAHVKLFLLISCHQRCLFWALASNFPARLFFTQDVHKIAEQCQLISLKCHEALWMTSRSGNKVKPVNRSIDAIESCDVNQLIGNARERRKAKLSQHTLACHYDARLNVIKSSRKKGTASKLKVFKAPIKSEREEHKLGNCET